MNIKCWIGLHGWEGCRCRACGRVRDQEHDWSEDCEACARCGSTRSNPHAWNGCTCTACKTTRDEGHEWDGPKCRKCGNTRDTGPALLAAIVTDDLSTFSALVGSNVPAGANILTLRPKDSSFDAPIHWAVRYNRLSILEYLINGKADINIQTRTEQGYTGGGATPLLEAVERGNIPVMSLLLKSGASVQRPNGFGHTPLHRAAHQGRLEAIQLLLSHGADIEARDKDGGCPLQSAAKGDQLHAVKALLSAGANVKAKNNYGKTAVWLHANNVSSPNVELLETLLGAGGDAAELRENSDKRVQSVYMAYISKARQAGGLAASPRCEISSRPHSDNTFVNDCLGHGLTEGFEPRFYRNIPALVTITELGNRGDYLSALDKLGTVWDEYKDFDFVYAWKAIILAKQGDINLATRVIDEGLRNAISKTYLCEQRAKIELERSNVRDAVMWWIRSILLQLSIGDPTHEGPFLYLGYVAQAVGENTCRNSLFAIVDRLTPAGRLGEAATGRLNSAVMRSDRETRNDITTAIKHVCSTFRG